ncbi:EF-hand calcium-binding domain-containing protein 6-like [Erpetoichthys calabaricus]|uniref:EF-hand calcium-binding domain-containing protein 6-like n=1 Tax=Erpetoichthys calabaricus TaxID=27687 RepID=UPI00223490D7|nr:EF-hand calcium-binding domain-containing protein 6-like [Erpetoichthys calabaricus]
MAAVSNKRPSSHLGISAKLPEIIHPLKRLGDPDTISIAGFSAQGCRSQRDVKSASWELPQGSRRRTECGRDSFTQERSGTSLEQIYKKHKLNKLDTWTKLDKWANLDKKQWAEGRSVSQDDSQASLQDTVQHMNELEFLLHERIQSNGLNPLRQLFLANDPTGRGTVSREALNIILTKFLGRFISSTQFGHLLDRLNVKEKSLISFETFAKEFVKKEHGDDHAWMDPIKRNNETIKKNTVQADLTLKKLVKDRYDMAGGEFVRKEYLMKTLGSENASGAEEQRRLLLSALSRVSSSAFRESQPKNVFKIPKAARGLSDAQKDRSLSISFEKWIKAKLEEGFQDMISEFQGFDLKNTGKVSREDFLKVLEKFHLPLKKEQLNLFLVRCSLEETSPDVSYVDFLHHFQDRTHKGMTQKILSDPHHRFNLAERVSRYSTVSALEAKLINFLQGDFLSLLKDFQKVDTQKTETLSQEQFRMCIETRLLMKMTDEEFEHFMEKVPTDRNGNVLYMDFLARFTRSKNTKSIFRDNASIMTDLSKKYIKPDRNKDALELRRSNDQLYKIIKDLLKSKFQEVEAAFNDLDVMNTRRLTPEMMYQLLKCFDIHPSISKLEVRNLWKTMITNQDDTLDFLHFVRHFRFSLMSACYPNAKRAPPVKGDSDFLIRSRKLNSDTEIMVEYLRAKVELLLDELWNKFQELDFTNSGTVTKDEFKDVLTELCPELTDFQCNVIATKFNDGENRVSYVNFLQPFEDRRRTFRSHKILTQTSQIKPLYNEVTQKGLSGLTLKIRQKMGGDWKTLQNACKKLDTHGSGFLLLPEFRAVLKLCNIVLNEDEIYQIMSHFDKQMVGKIEYAKFINDTLKEK